VQSTDQELLNFGKDSDEELDSADEDEEGEDEGADEDEAGEGRQQIAAPAAGKQAGKEKAGVTLAMVEGWCAAAREKASLGAVRNIMKVCHWLLSAC